MSLPRFASIGTPASRSNAAQESAGPEVPAFALPPPVTSSARLSLSRLPVDTRSAVHWQHYTVRQLGPDGGPSPSDLAAFETAIDTLLVESQQTAQRSASRPRQLSTCLYAEQQAVLWAVQRRPGKPPAPASSDAPSGSATPPRLRRRRLYSLWIFQVTAPEKSSDPQSSAQFTTPPLKWTNADRDLQAAGLVCARGSCALSDVYRQTSSAENSGMSHLTPRPDRRGMLRAFSRALEEFFLTKWVWTPMESYSGTVDQHANARAEGADRGNEANEEAPAIRPPRLKKRVSDDEEEGALGDEEASSAQFVASDGTPEVVRSNPRFWASDVNSPHRPMARFGHGVVAIDSPSEPRSILDSFEHNIPQHMTLRCFLDERGHIFLETWPRKPPTSRCVRRDDESGRKLLLAPLASRATLVRHLGALQLGRHEADEYAQLQQHHAALLNSLRVRGVDTLSLEDNWILCMTDGDQHLLWPAQLSFLVAPLQTHIRADQALLVDSTLCDVANRARAFVRESLGLKPADGEVWEDEDAGIDKGEKDDSDDGESVENATDDNGDDPIEESAAIDTGMEADDHKHHNLPPIEIERASPALKTAEKSRPDSHSASRRNSSLAVDTAPSKDEEMDLWGSFGFGDREETDMQPMPRSRDGFDDGGFGLVTEDDFSFFDDAAAPFGAFTNDVDDLDDEMQDVGDFTITQEELPADETAVVRTTEDQTKEADDGGQHVATTAPHQRMYEYDMGSGAASTVTTMDPPSLPGFTPGSISTSSPAVGGISAKTPRTPYSPGQDVADAHITIEGEHGVMYPHHQHATFTSNTSFSHPTATMLPEMPPPTEPRAALPKERQAWTASNRRDITSKYELGKFAMPTIPTMRKKQTDDQQTEDGERAHNLSVTSVASGPHRTRLGHRAQRGIVNGHARRASLTRHGLVGAGGAGLLAHKSRLAALRADDEMSEATHDDTMSERSSLMDDNDDEVSDDDDSMSSDEASDEVSVLMKQCESYLTASIGILARHNDTHNDTRVIANSNNQDDELTSEQRFDPIEWGGVVEHLIDNPPLRLYASKHSGAAYQMDVISRHDSQQLFVPMSGMDQLLTIEDNLAESTASPQSTKRADGVVQPVEPCAVLVGCQTSVVAMSPTALPYWDKLDLAGVSGPKHAVAYAVHLGDINTFMQSDLLAWFASMERVFSQCGFGSHVFAENGLLELDDIRTKSISQVLATIAGDAEQWSDTLESLLSRFIEPLSKGRFVIIYAIGVPHGRSPVWSLARLERDLRRMAVARLGVAPESVVVRPGPWEYFTAARSSSRAPRYDVRRVAASVYDSLKMSVGPAYNAEAHLPRLLNVPAVAICSPSFSLLPSTATSTLSPQEDGVSSSQFALSWGTKALNLLQHGALLHVAYRIATRPGEVTIVAIIDERGQGYTATAWRRTSMSMRVEIERIWRYTVQYTYRARTRWRVVLCKDGPMKEDEAAQWGSVLQQESGGVGDACALDVTVACAEHHRPLAIVLPLRGGEASDVGRVVGVSELSAASKVTGRYVDAARSKYVVYPQYRMSLCVPQDDDDDIDGEDEDDRIEIPLLALRSSLAITVPFCWNSSQAVQPVPHSEEWSDGTAAAAAHSKFRSAWAPTVPFQLWTHVLQVHSRAAAGDVTTSASALKQRLTRITKNFQDLELITRERSLLLDDETTAHLPWHLAIVRSLSTTSFTAFQQPTASSSDKSGEIVS